MCTFDKLCIYLTSHELDIIQKMFEKKFLKCLESVTNVNFPNRD